MKNQIQEVLGVPENLIDSARKFYDELKRVTLQKIKPSQDDETYEYSIKFDPPLNIGGYKTKKIKVETQIVPRDNFDKVTYASMGVSTSNETDTEKPYRGKINSNIKKPEFQMTLVTPEKWELSDVSNWFDSQKSEIISSLSHEFKHLFDDQKKEFEQFGERSRYIAGRDMPRFDIPKLDLFGHFIYYTTMIESLVRPTEIMAYLEEEKISKRDFINFLKDNKTYKKLKEVSDLTLDDIKLDILNNMEKVHEIFDLVDIDYENMTDNEKVDQLLDLWFSNYRGKNLNTYRRLMTTNMLEGLFGFSENKEKVFERQARIVSKFENNPVDFFRFEIKYLHKVAEEVMKKIHKLYALLPEDHFDKQTNLHNKISSRK